MRACLLPNRMRSLRQLINARFRKQRYSPEENLMCPSDSQPGQLLWLGRSDYKVKVLDEALGQEIFNFTIAKFDPMTAPTMSTSPQ